MALYDLSLGRGEARRRGWFTHLASVWMDGITHRRRERAASKALAAYSDRMLADVGISRNQIDRAVVDGRPSCDPEIPYWSR